MHTKLATVMNALHLLILDGNLISWIFRYMYIHRVKTETYTEDLNTNPT